MIEKIETLIFRICLTISVVLLLTITCFALMQVFGRYVFHNTFFWVEEITGIILGWMFALGAPMLWIKKDHIKMDAVDKFLSEKARKIWDQAINIIAIILGIIFLIGGVKALRLNTGYSISLLRYDESLKYYFVPVFGILLSITAFLSFLKGVKEFKEKEGTK